jgi:hypothetical protein
MVAREGSVGTFGPGQVIRDEVIDVLENPGEDRAGREGSRVAIGQTAGGRYLRIIYVPGPEPDSVFVIPHMNRQAGHSRHFAGVEGRRSNERRKVPERVE